MITIQLPSFVMVARSEKIIIQQPPMKELGKKRSCVKRTCTTGCLFILIFIVGIFLLVRFVSTPRSKALNSIPDAIKNSTVLYDAANIEKMHYIPGRDRHSLIETIALLPKIILAPVILNLGNRVDSNNNTWKEFSNYVREPITDTRDSYELFWSDLTAKQSFVFNYYEQGLLQQGYRVEVSTDRRNIKFSKDKISGTIRVDGDDLKKGSTSVVLRIFLPL